MLVGGAMFIVIITCIVAFTWASYQVFDDLMNKTYYTYGKFINDIKQVKTFSNRKLN